MRSYLKLPNPFLTFILLATVLVAGCSTDSEPTEENINPLPTDNQARLEAKTLYEDYYKASTTNGSDQAWTGNEAGCDAGSIPQTIKDKILRRIAYYRLAAGLTNEILEETVKSQKAQQAALMMKANNQLEHFPPDTWNCYTPDGDEGAGSSLLAMTRNAEAIDSYMRDQGAANYPVGHRRWLLWPRLQEIGMGNTDSSNAIWVLGNPGARPSDVPEFIAWPPAGYIPDTMVFPRWSFSIDGADFTATTISMRDAQGNSVSLQIEDLDNSYGDRTIVWVPSAISTFVGEDTLYTVTLSNVEVNGETQEFEYTVTLFDPNN